MKHFKGRDFDRDADFAEEIVHLVARFEEEYIFGDDEGELPLYSAEEYAETLRYALLYFQSEWGSDSETEALFRRADAVIRYMGKLWSEPADKLPEVGGRKGARKRRALKRRR